MGGQLTVITEDLELGFVPPYTSDPVPGSAR
jgi:hypothetical protein